MKMQRLKNMSPTYNIMSDVIKNNDFQIQKLSEHQEEYLRVPVSVFPELKCLFEKAAVDLRRLIRS